jgi:hypothetical protein
MSGPAQPSPPRPKSGLHPPDLQESFRDPWIDGCDRQLPSGWWLIPSALIGAAIWALLIWLALGIFS